MKTGVPQGTILGPTMFLLYINDISDNLQSSCKLYADDCVIYRVINNQSDACALQNDLDKLCEWSNKWQLYFNTEKCKVMHVTRKRNPYIYKYYMYGKLLEVIKEEKYLGVTINDSLTWSSHINVIARDANRKLGVIYRGFKNCSNNIDYWCSVWDPRQVEY